MLVLLLLAAAARSSASAPRPPKALGACAAVTAEDLHRVLGINFRGGQESGTGSERTCDDTAGTAQISVTIQTLQAPLDIPAEIEALKRALPGSTARRIDASSFLLEIPNAGAQLYTIRGSRDYLMISILGLGDAATIGPAAQQLARAALSRI